MEKEGEERPKKNETRGGKLPINSGLSHADMVRRLPRSKQVQVQDGEFHWFSEVSMSYGNTAARDAKEGMDDSIIDSNWNCKNGSDCDRKQERFRQMTQMLEVIQMKVCIKVEEDEFLVTVAEETVGSADKMGDFERDTGGNANTDSSPSLLLSIVPDSFGQANVGDHIPGADLPP
ncbi:hypothetical protein Ancab_017480 [Ancistrocladus abbreviatus]